MKSKLWFALVEHVSVPGTQVQVFSQPERPSKDEVLARCSDVPTSERKQIYVDGIFNISAVLDADDASMRAFKSFVAESL